MTARLLFSVLPLKISNVFQGKFIIVVYQPQAIRTTLDVYGENARKIILIDTPQFGKFMAMIP